MKSFSFLVLLAVLVGCTGSEVRPDTPIVVEKTVIKERSPEWATTDIEKPVPQDGTVYSKLRALDALSNAFDYVLCHRRLQRELNKGKAVDPETCKVEK